MGLIRFAYVQSGATQQRSVSLVICVKGAATIYNLSVGEVTAYYHVPEGKQVVRVYSMETGSPMLMEARGTIDKREYTAMIQLPNVFKLLKDEVRCPCPGASLVRDLSAGYGDYVKVKAGTSLPPSSTSLPPTTPSLVFPPPSSSTLPPSPLTISGGVYTVFPGNVVTHDNNVPLTAPPQSCEKVVNDFNLISFSGAWNSRLGIIVVTPLWDTVKVSNQATQVTSYAMMLRDSTLTFSGITFVIHKVDYDEYAILGTPDRSSFLVLTRKKCREPRTESMLRKLGYNTSR